MLTPNSVWSPAARARLSVTTELTSHRRWYPTSTATRGSTSCCTDAPNCQSPERTPHPDRSPGSNVESKTWVPKLGLALALQKSMPSGTPPAGVCVPCAALFSRTQSATKSRSSSCHVRVVVVDSREVGLSAVNSPPFCAASSYRPKFTLTDVRPVPNTSYATPPRGHRSL